MSDLNPSGPAQPPTSDAYTQSSNPTTSNPAERRATNHGSSSSDTTETRGPRSTQQQSDSDQAVPQSLGRGVHGSGPTDAREARETLHASGKNAQQQPFPGDDNVDAEQVATAGEGEVAHAVEKKHGTQRAPGQEKVVLDDFASDLGRKEAEQAPAREAVQAKRRAGVDVDGGTSDKKPHAEID